MRGLLATVDRDIFADLSGAGVRARTYARLCPAGEVSPEVSGRPPRRCQGLLEVLAFDLPDTVTMMRQSDVQRFGGLVVLREAGLAHLSAVPIRTRQSRHGFRQDDLLVAARPVEAAAFRLEVFTLPLAKGFVGAESGAAALET